MSSVRTTEADDYWAGVKVPCPTCNKEFTLPKAGVPPPITDSVRPPLTAPPPIPKPFERTLPTAQADAQIPMITRNPGTLRTIQIAIVCVAAIIGLWIWKGSSNVVTITAVDGTKVTVNVGAIESVLKQDSTTSSGATSVADVVARMLAIDTSSCPTDFQASYLAHIHAWEAMAQVEREAAAFKADREGAGDFVEGLVRGFLGDPMGKANEIRAAQTQLHRAYQAASREVKQTFNQVEELAVRYGARLPKK